MIALISSCSEVGALCKYIMGEGKGYELDRNLICGVEPFEIAQEFKLLQAQNINAKKKTFSVVISPHPDDGSALKDCEMKEISKKFMEKLGIDKSASQYLSYIHTNKDHRHIHLVISRVRLDSTLIDGSFIKLRAMAAAQEIAIEKGLISARSLWMESRQLHSPMLDEHWRIKKNIVIVSKKIFSQKVDSLEDFANKMQLEGIKLSFVENKKGELQGYRIFDTKTNMSFKSSEVNPKLQLKSLFSLGIFPEKNKKLTPALQKCLSSAMGSYILRGVKKIESEIQKDREYDR